MRKRYLSAIVAVGLLGSGVIDADAGLVPDMSPRDLLFASAPLDVADPDTSTTNPGELNRLAAAHLDANPRFVGSDGEVITVERVAAFLESKSSPLVPYAKDFVDAGLANDVDPRAVLAIAGIESSFGKRQRGHNAWGWSGGPGGSLSRWPDWPSAIHDYTSRLGAKYDTENIDVAFAKRYVPPNWRHWLSAVHQFMGEV